METHENLKQFLPSDNPRKFKTISTDFHAWLCSLTIKIEKSYSSGYYRNKESQGPGIFTILYFTEYINRDIRESYSVLAAKYNNSGHGPRAQEIHNLNPYPNNFFLMRTTKIETKPKLQKLLIRDNLLVLVQQAAKYHL